MDYWTVTRATSSVQLGFLLSELFITFLWSPLCSNGQTIIVCRCGFFFLSFFLLFLAYSQPSQTGCLPYFHTWCGLSANLECRFENNVLYAARWNTRRKSSPLCSNAQLVELHLRN